VRFGDRVGLLLAAAILVLNGCESTPGTADDPGQAKKVLCGRLLDSVSSAIRETDLSGPVVSLIEGLQNDQQRLLSAGESEWAAEVEEGIAALREPNEAHLKVSLYLEYGVSRARVDGISVILDQDSRVESYEFVSPKRAYEEFVEQWKNQSEMYEGMPQDVLPASFRIEVIDGADVEQLIVDLERLKGVDESRSNLASTQLAAPLSDLIRRCDLPAPTP
jgi:hypothetical protein